MHINAIAAEATQFAKAAESKCQDLRTRAANARKSADGAKLTKKDRDSIEYSLKYLDMAIACLTSHVLGEYEA